MPSQPVISRNQDIIAAGVAEQTILLNPKSWTYMHLNETAAHIWEALDKPRSIESVITALIHGYAVERATCEREVAEFVRDMSNRGFIVVDPAS